MAIEYKDDWLTGFSNMLNSAANITATDAQLKTGIQNQRFTQQFQLGQQKSNMAKEKLGATLGFANANTAFEATNRQYAEDDALHKEAANELSILDKQSRLLPSNRLSDYKSFKDSDFVYKKNIVTEKLKMLQARLDANKKLKTNQDLIQAEVKTAKDIYDTSYSDAENLFNKIGSILNRNGQ